MPYLEPNFKRRDRTTDVREQRPWDTDSRCEAKAFWWEFSAEEDQWTSESDGHLVRWDIDTA